MIDEIIAWVKEGIEGSGWLLASVNYDYDENVLPVASLGAGLELVPTQTREEVRLVLMHAGFQESLPPFQGSMFTNGVGKVFVIDSAELEVQTERLEIMGDSVGTMPHSPTTISQIKGSIVTQ